MAVFTSIPDYDLRVLNIAAGTNRRFTVITTSRGTINDTWTRVEGTTLVIIGTSTADELRRYLTENTQSQIRQHFPGKMSGSTNQELRQHLGIYRPHPIKEPV